MNRKKNSNNSYIECTQHCIVVVYCACIFRNEEMCTSISIMYRDIAIIRALFFHSRAYAIYRVHRWIPYSNVYENIEFYRKKLVVVNNKLWNVWNTEVEFMNLLFSEPYPIMRKLVSRLHRVWVLLSTCTFLLWTENKTQMNYGWIQGFSFFTSWQIGEKFYSPANVSCERATIYDTPFHSSLSNTHEVCAAAKWFRKCECRILIDIWHTLDETIHNEQNEQTSANPAVSLKESPFHSESFTTPSIRTYGRVKLIDVVWRHLFMYSIDWCYPKMKKKIRRYHWDVWKTSDAVKRTAWMLRLQIADHIFFYHQKWTERNINWTNIKNKWVFFNDPLNHSWAFIMNHCIRFVLRQYLVFTSL